MAEHVHLFLKADGKAVKGEPTQTSQGRDGSIECVSYQQEGATPFEPTTGQASGRRQYQPLKIMKRIDASSPLLWQALTTNQKLEGEFRFYRPDPEGHGSTEHFYTVVIRGGYIASIRQFVQHSLTPGEANEPPLEEITFIFHDIIWTYKTTGAEHSDSWANS